MMKGSTGTNSSPPLVRRAHEDGERPGLSTGQAVMQVFGL